MAGGHQWVPNLSSRVTHSNLEGCSNKIEQEDAPYTGLDPNKQEHVYFAVGDEDSQILEEN